jgi:hypothetical protein
VNGKGVLDLGDKYNFRAKEVSSFNAAIYVFSVPTENSDIVVFCTIKTSEKVGLHCILYN